MHRSAGLFSLEKFSKDSDLIGRRFNCDFLILVSTLDVSCLWTIANSVNLIMVGFLQ